MEWLSSGGKKGRDSKKLLRYPKEKSAGHLCSRNVNRVVAAKKWRKGWLQKLKVRSKASF
jgi:hypothetical protein